MSFRRTRWPSVTSWDRQASSDSGRLKTSAATRRAASGAPEISRLTSHSLDRAYILAEIRRTAEANSGTPLGRARFAVETGIREADWSGRYWARWSDALSEAGFPPNELQSRYADDDVLAALVAEIRRLGRMPTRPELRLRRRQDKTFPSPGVFERFGSKAALVNTVAEYCRAREDHQDVLEMIASETVEAGEQAARDEGADDSAQHGFVYLLKSGRYYKIGHTFDVGRRRYDIAIQMPEPVREEHVIRTDDPVGIERYWHSRFADRRKNGEWFELIRADITAFKRRRFM